MAGCPLQSGVSGIRLITTTPRILRQDKRSKKYGVETSRQDKSELKNGSKINPDREKNYPQTVFLLSPLPPSYFFKPLLSTFFIFFRPLSTINTTLSSPCHIPQIHLFPFLPPYSIFTIFHLIHLSPLSY